MTQAERAKRRASIAYFLRMGGTEQEACIKFNVSGFTVRAACKEFGIETAREANRVSVIIEAIALLRVMSAYTVAKKLRCNKHRIYRIQKLARERGLLC